MKFRYKVIILNLLLLSLATGVVGFLLMRRSYRLTMDTEIKSAVTENNLVQSSVEYSLLDVINKSRYDLKVSLPEIGRTVFSGMLSGEEALMLKYGTEYLYLSDEKALLPPGELFDIPENARKNYLITEKDGHTYLYVTSDTAIDGKTLNIVTCRDITEMSLLLDQSIRDYRMITIILLSVSVLILLILSRLLTRPLEKLSDTTDAFAGGDYSTRSDIHSEDEVGHLANRFNSMADSVEEHVEELNDMIHRREQFVADFTHEIKTPMTSIIGYADTMRSIDLTKEEQQSALGYIFSEGKRLEAMSFKLFDLLYLKDHPIEFRPISAETLAEDVNASTTPLMEASDIHLKISAAPGILSGDPELLKTVFINLIDNARKASKPGDTVELKGCMMPPGDKDDTAAVYRFTVKDHGIGISEEDQKKIFDEFFMVDKSRTRAAGGAGLGMSLVAVILERHHARLELRSKPGEGTEIDIYFDTRAKDR